MQAAKSFPPGSTSVASVTLHTLNGQSPAQCNRNESTTVDNPIHSTSISRSTITHTFTPEPHMITSKPVTNQPPDKNSAQWGIQADEICVTPMHNANIAPFTLTHVTQMITTTPVIHCISSGDSAHYVLSGI